MRRKLLAFAALALSLCGCPALGAFITGAAPIVGSALGSYAQAAQAAQAGLPADDPAVVGLRSTLAALAAAEGKLDAAKKPVECTDLVPVGAPLPPPAVNVDALALALADVAASNRAVVDALSRVKAKKPKKAKPSPDSVLPFAAAGSDGAP